MGHGVSTLSSSSNSSSYSFRQRDNKGLKIHADNYCKISATSRRNNRWKRSDSRPARIDRPSSQRNYQDSCTNASIASQRHQSRRIQSAKHSHSYDVKTAVAISVLFYCASGVTSSSNHALTTIRLPPTCTAFTSPLINQSKSSHRSSLTTSYSSPSLLQKPRTISRPTIIPHTHRNNVCFQYRQQIFTLISNPRPSHSDHDEDDQYYQTHTNKVLGHHANPTNFKSTLLHMRRNNRTTTSTPVTHSPLRFFKRKNLLEQRRHYNDALLNRILKTRPPGTATSIPSSSSQQQSPNQDYRMNDILLPNFTVTAGKLRHPISSSLMSGTDFTSSSSSSTSSFPIHILDQNEPKHKIYNIRKKRIMTPEQYNQAKLEWAKRYTSLTTLRDTFGTNRNKLWGDFDTTTTRKLYHTLLPRAVLGLYELGLFCPTDLAPLAYEARIAAKKYARERCVVPARLMAMFYDGFRNWRDWGTWSMEGMSWEQVWNKYETQILEEILEEDGLDLDMVEEEDIAAQICLRILQRSCITNEMVDKLFLRNGDDVNRRPLEEDEDNEELRTRRRRLRRRQRKRHAERELRRIALRLEKDMRELLETNANDASMMQMNNMTDSPYFSVAASRA